ncbi:class I SAM-dependent methyltransferase [Vicingus serpentipes]|jgi:ubiquinone/menaquinone biosynthesis C-methylase UbiE|uniref:Class I SAM-dependent methyltransferase n=1 Tax=Vicingus serpentipes TaxID=1926625 RepID=A0A5C6RUV0_9FLAO|nr:class I SAM-dependent methyltransferase [Vicingus serpentipes]TXB65814.1 class I SAM-dependent methyltransferase [Vicingus serpentipes]
MKREFDNFDEFAKDYRATHDKSVEISGADSDYFSEYKILEVLKYEQANDSIRILDFGCGDGNSSKYFRKYFNNSQIVGIDVSEQSIKEANQKKIENAIFQSFNGSTIPFDDNQFDLIFTSMVFHHIEHKLHENILNEIRRVLKPGGRFYNFEHNPNNPLTRKVVNECPFDEDAVLLKPSYHKMITIKSGLNLKNLNFTLFLPRHKFFKPLLGLEKILTWCPIGAQYYIRSIK